jgi:hypothetical protein
MQLGKSKQKPIYQAHVLLLSWEDDNLGVEKEIQRLGHAFSNLYGFEVHEFGSPRKTPGKATTTSVSTFLENDRQDSLLIVCYAGHSRLNKQTNEPPIWAAIDEPNSPTLPSGGVQQLLEEAESDVLPLYDSCHSSHPAVNISGQGVTEDIAACGFETQAPAVGPHSFTNALISQLEEAFAGPPFSIAELHSRIIGSLKNWKPDFLRNEAGNVWTDQTGRPKRECHKRRTPVHCFLTNETPYRSIMLAPLILKLSQSAVSGIELAESSNSSGTDFIARNPSSDCKQTASTFQTRISEPADIGNSLKVLLAVRLEDNFLLDNDEDTLDKVRTWTEWLRNMPEGAKDVKIQGVYNSFATLVLMSMPAVLCDLSPPNGAYSFIGFVHSENIASRFLALDETLRTSAFTGLEAHDRHLTTPLQA